MASIPASQAQSKATAALQALQAADNATFIAATDAGIQDAINMGKTLFNANTFGYVDAMAMTSYYIALGYRVSLPSFRQNLDHQPAQLFGEIWEGYWEGTYPNLFQWNHKKNPVRILIEWNPPTPY